RSGSRRSMGPRGETARAASPFSAGPPGPTSSGGRSSWFVSPALPAREATWIAALVALPEVRHRGHELRRLDGVRALSPGFLVVGQRGRRGRHRNDATTI